MTTNFKMEEFTASKTAKKLNIKNEMLNNEDLNIKELVINLLQPLRDKFGRITINSGFRNEELNKAVGGVSNSGHCKGTCADITLGSIEKNLEAFNWIKDNCEFRQLIWEKGGKWIHVEYMKEDNKKQVLNIK